MRRRYQKLGKESVGGVAAALCRTSPSRSTLSIGLVQIPGWSTHYVLFFIHLETRLMSIAGMTRNPA